MQGIDDADLKKKLADHDGAATACMETAKS